MQPSWARNKTAVLRYVIQRFCFPSRFLDRFDVALLSLSLLVTVPLLLLPFRRMEGEEKKERKEEKRRFRNAVEKLSNPTDFRLLGRKYFFGFAGIRGSHGG